LCAVEYGHRWVGYAVDGFTPRMPAGCEAREPRCVQQPRWLWKRADGAWAEGDGRTTSQWTAFVNTSDFVRFFARVVDAMQRGAWTPLLGDYTEALRRNPDPARRSNLARGSDEGSHLSGRFTRTRAQNSECRVTARVPTLERVWEGPSGCDAWRGPLPPQYTHA